MKVLVVEPDRKFDLVKAIPVNLKSSVEVNMIHKNGIGNNLVMMRVVCSPVMNPDEDDFLLQRQLLDDFSFPG